MGVQSERRKKYEQTLARCSHSGHVRVWPLFSDRDFAGAFGDGSTGQPDPNGNFVHSHRRIWRGGR